MDAFEFLSSPVTWAITVVSCLYILYKYVTSQFNYFVDQGIPGPKPVPFFGNMWGLWKKNTAEYDVSLVKKYGKIFGYFDGPNPNLWITDLEMIKAIFVKDFDHFVDRRAFKFKSNIVRKWLTVLEGQEWKDVRSSVTPAFTTGKIKKMSLLINDCVHKLCDSIAAQTEGKINAKLIFNAFTMDVIARCAFGLKIDNLGDKDDPFIQNAQIIFNPPSVKTPLILLPFTYPKLFSLFGESLFVSKELKFFFQLLQNMLQERSQSKEKYHDFIEVADEAISAFTKDVGGKKVAMWSREEIEEIVMGQSTLFMLAGFDTTATTLTSTCFELARNPDIQDKLYDSIITKLEDHDDICHEFIQDMPYLEQVILEVLRFYPAAVRTERQCTKDISYDNGRINIKAGVIITVPIYALHHMEEYYPNPEIFDPERWTPENKAKRSPYSFMAFGVGPRNCVGMRFAMEEMKMAVCTLVKKFRFFTVKETPEKLQFDDGFQSVLQPIHAILGIESR
ncbi:lithocholate 6-beta-hydroxylase-like [Daphnia magna]|uniref:lithocholate 6-beta-hydroxylase n=1 Tax=Daphnia magna TaxID=35525 RepID=UPI001E1BCC41|nr:lithocholate 6-beta-hydroxylase [Daphnia magna]XP_045033453.1 lithocholate 6-beta-hydroxylase-like [Daphnia magna]